jgi:integrase/recombinase XerD
MYNAKGNTMVLLLTIWEAYLNYLLIEKKRNIIPGSENERIQHSRFKILCTYFQKTTFNRENFNKFLLEKKNEGKKNSTLNAFIETAKNLHGFLLAEYHYDSGLENYTYFSKERKVLDPLTPDEIKNLAEVYIEYRRNREEQNKKYKALIYTEALTGGRIDEILRLEKKQVFSNYLILYGRKTGQERIVPVSPFLHALLIEQIESSPSQLVFQENGHSMSDKVINRELKRRAEAIHLNKRVHNHLFRHSLVVQLLKENVSVVHISRILGHNSLESINNYSHLLLEDLDNAMSQHPLNRDTQTFDQLKTRLKSSLTKIMVGSRFVSQIKEDNNSIQIQLQNVCHSSHLH